MVAAKYGVKVINIPWPETERLIESGSTVFDSAKLDALIGEKYQMQVKQWLSEK